MDFKLLCCVWGEESLPALRAPCQNFCCSHRFRRACQNQVLPRETHRAGKRPGCASWSRGPAAAVAVLRPQTRPQPPTVSASNGCGSSLPRSLLWCSVASLSPFPAQVSCLSLLSHMRKEYKICANCQTGSAVCVQRLMVQELLGIISPHHQDARGVDPARWSHRYQSDSITVIRRVRGDSERCTPHRPDNHVFPCQGDDRGGIVRSGNAPSHDHRRGTSMHLKRQSCRGFPRKDHPVGSSLLVGILVVLVTVSSALAWNKAGHMVSGALA